MSDKMWGEDNPDPGGTGRVGPSVQELSELKDQNEQQLVLIAQLKEMLRKEQSTVSQDKVEEYVNTLNRARAKRSKLKKESGSSSSSSATATANIDANKKEKINLLRQQLEENKAKLAERGKSQKGIEEMVTQLQAQLKDTSTPSSINVSLTSEAKNLDYTENSSQKELFNILLIKEKKITELAAKSQKLEGTVLDLQENLKEKDSVIDARTKAITLMTESLSKKGKHTLDELDETKEQMRKMQQDFVTLEGEMKARQLTLLGDLKAKNYEISELKEIVATLEKKNSELEQSVPVLRDFDNNAPEPVEHKLLIEKLQSENQCLLEKIEDLTKKSVDFKAKFVQISHENSNNLLTIAELEKQLKAYGETKQNQDSDKEVKKLKKEIEELIVQVSDKENENKTLSRENEKNLSRVKELESQLENALTDLKLLKNTGMAGTTKSAEQENQEITKLKKQLDEVNKNMIKTKAIQKGKIKELNKKLDQFRKMNDANALINQLQNEIVKLNEKIAELEDEKGNMQLKMVESTNSSKEDYTTKQLEDKLAKLEADLEEKDKVIQILETEALDLKAQLNQKNLEEIKVTSQVSSEMSSICYEEQIEALENEKKKLLDQLQNLNVEKESLLEELELMKKEKADINTKLESYIQENMDLIDKLEKLSTEKVSSAESIEIVEGLTQQEKIELAAYQKHLNPEETLKCHEDDPPAELDESVQQLSEDTAELLQRIEMFTQERKEVMHKMETLRDENAHLNIKLKEIENNRDILEETYEQLQNEKEALEKQLADKIPESLDVLQNKYEGLKEENEALRKSVKQLDNVNQEKFNLEENFKDLVDNNSSLETKLNSNLDEINNYQLIIEENKDELIHSADTIAKLQSQLEERENDIQELNMNISELRGVISELQEQESVEELRKLSVGKDETINRLQDQLSAKENEIKELQKEISKMEGAISDLAARDKQISELNSVISELRSNNSDETIEKLQSQLSDRDNDIEELQNNIAELQSVINELQAKQSNIETMEDELGQLKTSLNDQLEEALKTEELQTLLENQQSEIEKLRKEVANKDEMIKSLHNDIEEKNQSFKVISGDIKGKYLQLQSQLENNEAHALDLTNKNKEQLEKMKKIAANLKKKTVAYQELEAELNRIKQQETGFKINELELQLETNEAELSRFKQKVDELQQEVQNLQQINSELQANNTDLTEKLNLTSKSFKEKSLLEDQLELRLAEVTANDEALVKQLQEVQLEREQLSQKNTENEELIKKLKIKLKKAHDKVAELKGLEVSLEELGNANRQLTSQMASMEEHHKLILSQNDVCKSDYEKIESDYQIQLEELSKAKNDLTMDNERLLEKVQELILEADQYKSQLVEMDQNNSELESKLQKSSEDLLAFTEDHERTKQQFDLEINQLRAEIEALQSNLQQSNEKLLHSAAEIENLGQVNRQLSQEIETLHYAKSSLGASLEACQKVNEELSQEIKALEFAKAALEASCEASQKLEVVETNDRLLEPSSAFTLSNLGQAPKQTEQLPEEFSLFNAFTQPEGTSSSVFDNLIESPVVQETPALQGALATHQATIEDGREALLNKIKTLEFLLYNNDREKEIALDQCTELVSEVTKLICEKPPEKPRIQMELESQIVPQDVLDHYDGPPCASTNKIFGQQVDPVVEEVIQPKKAYICFDDEAQASKVMEENDDGWGWGPEEARLEQEHMNTLENMPQVKNLLTEISQLKENIKVLHMERETHLEEINQLQIKSAKLLKKCKELKSKGSSKKADDGLDDTILEELKQQIISLEKRIKELSNEYEKEKSEKAALASKLETITGANEKMTQSREILDSEVLRWKRLYQEAQDKLENVDWGTAEVKKKDLPRAQDSSDKVKELEDTIKDLSLDNEELQALLEEQREKMKELSGELQNKVTERSHLLQQVDDLNAKLIKMNELTEKLNLAEAEIGIFKSQKVPDLSNLEHLEDKIKDLTVELERQIKINGELQLQVQSFTEKSDSRIKDLSAELEQTFKLKEELQLQVEVLTDKSDARVQQLEAQLDCVNLEKAAVEQKLNDLESAWPELNIQLQQETAEKAQLWQQVEELKGKLNESNAMQHTSEELKQAEMNVARLQSKLDQFASEKTVLELEKTQWEQANADLNQTLQKERAEMAHILEQSSLFQNANERLIEMKEQQDAEIRRLKENDLSNKVKEMEDACSELATQLDVEKSKNIQLEEVISTLQAQAKPENLSEELEDKLNIINQLESSNQQLTLNNDELKSELAKREESIQELNSIIQMLESEKSLLENVKEQLEQTVKDLNESWQLQVDQRGADVAESWKMHLEMVEKDFEMIQSKLQSDLAELEEKNNILMNENNELRKNVDQEIRNEVDKMSMLQQTISDKDKQIEEVQNNMQNYLSELEKLRVELADKNQKLSSIDIIVETTQKQFDEKRVVIEEIVSLLEKRSPTPLSYEKQDIIKEIQRQLEIIELKDTEIRTLQQNLSEMDKAISANKRELAGLNQVIEDLEKDLSVVHEKEAELVRLNTELRTLELVKQERDSLALDLDNLRQEYSSSAREIAELKSALSEKSQQLKEINSEQVKQDRESVNLELEQLKQEYSNAVRELSEVKQSLHDRDQQIEVLNQQMNDLREEAKNDSNKEMERLSQACEKLKEENLVLQDQVSQCQTQLEETTQKLLQKEQENQELNANIMQYYQQNLYYEQEVTRLNGLINQKDIEYNNSLEMLKNNQLSDIQRHYDEIVSNKDLDINSLRSQVQELMEANQNYAERLNQDAYEKQDLEQKLAEQNKLVDEDTKQLEELKLIIEDQESRIAQLRKQLYDKSNQYDSLIAEMDVGRVPVTKQPASGATSLESLPQPSSDSPETVSRAELDFVTYILHQRDVRCEELTVEVRQLLEERDTLQLRLSNAIREKEALNMTVAELRKAVIGEDHNESSTQTTLTSSEPSTSSPSKSSATFLAASGTELAKDPLDSNQSLAMKLSELKKVGYKKDKTFVDEQEARQLQQLAVMHEHISEVAKLPPEAAAKLVDASYTLSRDVQSPSKVLLNWLWGKNPPKANDS